MGRVKVIKTGPIATIQDFGRFGYRRYGIPQSGAMDRAFMIAANQQMGNPENYPVIEFALMGMELEAVEETVVSVVGASLKINGQLKGQCEKVLNGDKISISAPTYVYGYLALGGKMHAKKDFGSVSTYERAGFGGLDGRALQRGDELVTNGKGELNAKADVPSRENSVLHTIRIMKGPEWNLLKELPSFESFQVDGSSDRMGIRLTGARLDCDYQEIASSAVIPGTIQLPADGQPIILMNDCQTTGGYPRIGKVIDEDLGKLAQLKPGKDIKMEMI